MGSHNSHRTPRRIMLLLLFASVFALLLLMQIGMMGYAARQPPQPGNVPQVHDDGEGGVTARVVTATATPVTGIQPGQTFAASTLYRLEFSGFDFCNRIILPAGGEAWILSDQEFVIGDTNTFVGDEVVDDDLLNTLYVRRCLEIEESEEAIFVPSPELFDTAILTAALDLETPTLRGESLAIPELSARQVFTLIPSNQPPVLEPVIPQELELPPIPTLEAPEQFENLPPATVVLERPTGDTVSIPRLDAAFRPDLWSYQFSPNSPTGLYTVTITSGGNVYQRNLFVRETERIYLTNRQTGEIREEFDVSSLVRINYAGFEPDRTVLVSLYRIVRTVDEAGRILALVDTWTFDSGPGMRQELLSQRLLGIDGPPFGNFILFACYVDECDKLPAVPIQPFPLRIISKITWPELAFAAFFVEPSAAALPIPRTLQPIDVASGEEGTTIGLFLEETGTEGYVLTAPAGQRLLATVDSPNVYVYLLDPRGELLLEEEAGGGLWEYVIPETGQYTVLVQGTDNAHLTVALPPEGGADPSSNDWSDIQGEVLAKLATSPVPNPAPQQTARFVDALFAHRDDFGSGVSRDNVLDALQRDDVGDRIAGVVGSIWSDWARLASQSGQNALIADVDDFNLSPFRKLVIRLVQGTQGPLSAQEQQALYSFLVRPESADVWRTNPDGVIGAINREIFR